MDIIKSLKSLMNVKNVQTVNNVFKLHYKFTMSMLIVFSIALTSRQYFGKPIVCNTNFDKEIMETYCYYQGTYIIMNTTGGKNK